MPAQRNQTGCAVADGVATVPATAPVPGDGAPPSRVSAHAPAAASTIDRAGDPQRDEATAADTPPSRLTLGGVQVHRWALGRSGIHQESVYAKGRLSPKIGCLVRAKKLAGHGQRATKRTLRPPGTRASRPKCRRRPSATETTPTW